MFQSSLFPSNGVVVVVVVALDRNRVKSLELLGLEAIRRAPPKNSLELIYDSR
jgi:hypothetical protein